MGRRIKMKKAPLFEHEVPCYRKRAVNWWAEQKTNNAVSSGKQFQAANVFSLKAFFNF